jgi:hypothetical protein
LAQWTFFEYGYGRPNAQFFEQAAEDGGTLGTAGEQASHAPIQLSGHVVHGPTGGQLARVMDLRGGPHLAACPSYAHVPHPPL